MNKIYYIGFYGDSIAYDEGRVLAPSGVNKMDYIAKTIANNGLKLTIISPAWVKFFKGQKIRFYGQRKFNLDANLDCVITPSISLPIKYFRVINSLIAKIWLISFILFQIKKEDNIIVYNSPFYFVTIYWLKKIINFNLIMEVEEIYSIVFSMNKQWRKKEKRLFSLANSYIFPNDLLPEYLDIKNKNHIVVYGSYFTEHTDLEKHDFGDNKIHLIYAGIIDTLKNGAFNAIKCAKYLSDIYILHIIGFGKSEDINHLCQEISFINNTSACKVIYDGNKIGSDYIKYVLGCHIGLSTQNNEGEYLKITFPSKVLAYSCLGLNTVSAKMECLTKSAIDNLIHYYEEDTPESIANTILKIKLHPREIILNRIAELNVNFMKNIIKLIK